MQRDRLQDRREDQLLGPSVRFEPTARMALFAVPLTIRLQ